MRLEALTLANFGDYEALTAHGDDGKVCYCSFWHLNCGMERYDAMKRDDPGQLREIVRQRVASGFHVGALAYEDGPVAWVSVGPLPQFYWAWKRVAALGVEAGTTAGILCLTLAPALRGQGRQRDVAQALIAYGRAQGWTAIEAYPFDDEAVARQPERLAWPGFEGPFREAGYERIGAHWLARPPEYGRWICRRSL